MAVYKITQKQMKQFKQKWARVPLETIMDKKISGMSLRLLSWMLSKPETWGFSVSHMSTEFGVHRMTISRWLADLVKQQYVERDKSYNKKTHQYHWSYIAYPFPLPRLVKLLSIKAESTPNTAKKLPDNVVLFPVKKAATQ